MSVGYRCIACARVFQAPPGPSEATMALLERGTHPEWTQMGGKYGATAGFTGHLIVECNAVTEWLLRCCETIGLGGKTAFGFGRVRVTDA